MYEMEERRSEERFTHRYKKKTCIWIYTADRQTEMAMFGKRASGGGADRGGACRGGPRARGKEVGGRTEKGA